MWIPWVPRVQARGLGAGVIGVRRETLSKGNQGNVVARRKLLCQLTDHYVNTKSLMYVGRSSPRREKTKNSPALQKRQFFRFNRPEPRIPKRATKPAVETM